ncbi:MAG: hypothetical protein GF350_07300 [Chitinivibrionales bacterium]|nr:hypothetical protein [Chitinivibrionales bacterium]
MNTQLAKMIVFSLVIVLLALSFSQALKLTSAGNGPDHMDNSLSLVPGMSDRPVVEKALQAAQEYEPFTYAGDNPTPFRSLEKGHIVSRSSKGGKKEPDYVRNKLILKGVLFKKQPLAIIEDESGKSHICGIGDEVHSQRILAIGEEGVKLRDPLGSYEIPAQDE